MSIDFYIAAKTSAVNDPVQMCVLKELALLATKNGICWPSLNYLHASTRFSVATIKRAISSLIGAGHLKKTRRFGLSNFYTVTPIVNNDLYEFFKPGSTPEYRAELYEKVFAKKTKASDFQDPGLCESELSAKESESVKQHRIAHSELIDELRVSSSDSSERAHQNLRIAQSEPIEGLTVSCTMSSERAPIVHLKDYEDSLLNNKEHSPPDAKPKKQKIEAQKPEDVDQEIWRDYLALRKSKKGGVLTATALRCLVQEAEKASLTLEQVLLVCLKRSWVGFDAKWLSPPQPTQKNAKAGRLSTALPTEVRFNGGEDLQ